MKSGDTIGPYVVAAKIGEGGMGEVYRAHDPRLHRDVAIKVLPAAFAGDPDRLHRFEQEARAAAALSHPNIVAVFDVVTADGRPCVVTELLDGRTLRELLAAGPVPPRKAVEYAIQICQGLAAAHEKGIVHRDLKPENLFVTAESRVKILDFGLAKLAEAVPAGIGAAATMATRAVETTPGLVLGTVGYMSPEQVRGQTVDHRTDLFSFGAILYETLSGSRAFKGDSAADTLSAILKEDPPELATPGASISPAIDRIVHRCLEKSPTERFQSAKDLTFALEAVSQGSARSSQIAAAIAPPPRRAGARRAAGAIGGALIAVVLAAAGYVAGSRRAAPPVQPSFEQLTFRRGAVRGARFGPDGKTIVYSAAWDGGPNELFSTRAGSTEARSLGLPAAHILAISRTGEMAVALNSRPFSLFDTIGTLARADLAGGAPRPLLENVNSADWGPDGQLAIVRLVSSGFQIEYPIGTVLLDRARWISDIRVSPDGRSVAFVLHPNGDEGSVQLIGPSRKPQTLSSNWRSIQGLVWAPGGKEIWFSAARTGALRAVWAVPAAGGAERIVFRTPRRVTIQDIARDGTVLVTTDSHRSEIASGLVNGSPPRNLSWFDFATSLSLSRDGRLMEFTESGEGAGERYGIYLRPTDGSPALRLADGEDSALSPDGTRSIVVSAPNHLTIMPAGAGEPVPIAADQLESIQSPGWFPDSSRFVITAPERGHRPRVWMGAAGGGALTPLTPEGNTGRYVSPDSKWLVVRKLGGSAELYPVGGGEPRPLPTYGATDSTLAWAPDGRSLIVRETGPLPAVLVRIDIASGRRTPFAALVPPDAAGVSTVSTIALSADLGRYAFAYSRTIGELVVVHGLK